MKSLNFLGGNKMRLTYTFKSSYCFLKLLSQGEVNPFPNKPWFLRVCCTRLLKTLWEKEKLLVTSNFSFSHSVFYLFGELSAILIKSEIVISKLFQFGRVQNFSCGKGLKPLPHDENLAQTKFKVFEDDKLDVTQNIICLSYCRKHCGKGRKCWLPVISPFPTVFSKGFFFSGMLKTVIVWKWFKTCCICIVLPKHH